MTQAEVTFDELHAEYLREIASKVRAEAEVERCSESAEAMLKVITEDLPRVMAERDELRAENERLRAVAHAANGAFLAFAKAPPELADDHELMRAMSTLGAALDSYDTLRESS
jgi:hypothetical protein